MSYGGTVRDRTQKYKSKRDSGVSRNILHVTARVWCASGKRPYLQNCFGWCYCIKAREFVQLRGYEPFALMRISRATSPTG